MSHDWIPDRNFFTELDAEDARTIEAVRVCGCPLCGGRLDRADYPRKPRGGGIGAAGENLDRRRSLCCAREGCRRRKTPPSLVFLGRRVYLAITIVVAVWRSAFVPPPSRRTVGRWRGWFAALRGTSWWTANAGRIGAIEAAEPLPAAIIERLLPTRAIADALIATLAIVAPATTT